MWANFLNSYADPWISASAISRQMGGITHEFAPRNGRIVGCRSQQRSAKCTVVHGREAGAKNGPGRGSWEYIRSIAEMQNVDCGLNLNRGVMRKVLNLVALFAVALSCHAQSQVTDLKTLVGRKAIAQRIPFYQPGTYHEISKEYAGQEVTIIAVKPSTTFASMPFLTASAIKSLPPESRAAIENMRNAATLIVQFADGTKADTGPTPVMPSMLPGYLELVQEPGAISSSPSPVAPTPVVPIPVASAATPAQVIPPSPDNLTDDQVAAAIDRATHGKRHAIGLTLNDMQMFLLSGMICDTCGTSGYTVTIYTPELWIEQLAVNAQNEMQPLSVKDVPQEARESILRVVALPSRADYLTGAGLSMASSVHRVVLTNSKRTETIQPLRNDNGYVEGNSALRSTTYTSATASFPMSEVRWLQSQDKNAEFFVVVVGDNQNKYFKVKARFDKELFGTIETAPSVPNGFQLGVSVETVKDSDVEDLKLSRRQGVVVRRVNRGSLAERMGIQVKDVVLEIDSSDVEDAQSFVLSVRSGAAKTFRIWRDGRAIDMTVPQA